MRSAFVLKFLNAFHRTVLFLSFGKIGWRAAGMTVLELTTTGRRSGRPHTLLLTSPWQLGDTYAVVASRGGADHHADWFLNLQANPQVEVSIAGGPKERRHARVADAAERAEIWPRAIAAFPHYARYQKRTTREIPVVLLEPERPAE